MLGHNVCQGKVTHPLEPGPSEGARVVSKVGRNVEDLRNEVPISNLFSREGTGSMLAVGWVGLGHVRAVALHQPFMLARGDGAGLGTSAAIGLSEFAFEEDESLRAKRNRIDLAGLFFVEEIIGVTPFQLHLPGASCRQSERLGQGPEGTIAIFGHFKGAKDVNGEGLGGMFFVRVPGTAFTAMPAELFPVQGGQGSRKKVCLKGLPMGAIAEYTLDRHGASMIGQSIGLRQEGVSRTGYLAVPD